MNERYGKYTAPSGKTRKSAASAKPKRSGGTTDSGKKSSSAASKRKPLVVHPQTPEYKRWRTIWWALLGGAIVLSMLAWWLWQDVSRRSLGNWVLGGGYVLIFSAMGIDWLKLRVLRREWTERTGGGSAGTDEPSKESSSDKSDES